MSADEYRRIDQLFLDALGLPQEQREAFLAQTCGHNPELRRKIEAMLAADAETRQMIDQPRTTAAEVLIDESSEFGKGGWLGPYRLTHEIGRGGMGVVYAAVRDDDHYHQRVAVKLIKTDLAGRGAGAESVLERFRRERQILARLEHP